MRASASSMPRACAGQRRTGGAERQPWFCSGCPHNTSARARSLAMAGIGCHFMAVWMDRAPWASRKWAAKACPGSARRRSQAAAHVRESRRRRCHSGFQAIRRAIAAGVNVTYKILAGDAVAMTGGQPVDGILTVPQMTRELGAEGAKRIVVVTDSPTSTARRQSRARHHGAPPRRLGCRAARTARHRRLHDPDLDQTCATEKRRRRKRGKMVDEQTRGD